MKRKHFLLLLVPVLCLTSCNNDDDQPQDMTIFPETWKLINVSGSIAGVSHDFAPGTIRWVFHPDQTVTVINTNTNENVEDFFESGTYDMHFEVNEATPDMCTESLFIDNLELGCYSQTENQLVLSQVWADGYILTFVK